MAQSNGSVALQTLALVGLRGGFLLVAQQYLWRSLYADLRQVIRDETSTAAPSYSAPDSPDSDYLASPLASPPGKPSSSSLRLSDQLSSLRSASTSPNALLPTSNGASKSGADRRRASAGFRNAIANNLTNTTFVSATSFASKSNKKGVAPKLAATIFCISVSECVTLFALILFGGMVGERARLLNWELSLGTVLAFIVLVIPFGMCLLFSLRSKVTSTSLKRITISTFIPFSIWIVGLYTLGDVIGKALGVSSEDNLHIGLLTTTLDRICVPGTILIAALSGGAAINSAWEAYEWRERFKSDEIVTEGHINAAIRSVNQTRTELAARSAELDAIKSGSQDGQSQGFFGRMFSSPPNAAKIKSLQAEIEGLEALESQMSRDLQLMRKRKEISELGQTWYGKFRQVMGWLFSVYCVYRILISLMNLIFGTISDNPNHTKPSDYISSALETLAHAIGWKDLDITTISKVVGLLLIGSIIFVNLNFVLGYVSRVFRATSAGNSASFMLLFLSQLMAVYLITSLISLPSVEDQDDKDNPATILLQTLPDFRIFQRLFDGVFLVSATIVFVVRWLHRKIRVDDHLGLQDFV